MYTLEQYKVQFKHVKTTSNRMTISIDDIFNRVQGKDSRHTPATSFLDAWRSGTTS